ncbi:MAG TPA: isochorismatase family cysteine hydrolase [Nitrososphaeraceae archaeon]|jgi:ureidoacrylate peracid hydrolase|nr:isochorismatase family cysteine hydrolase [Nitrososphaeraceae archaeon]
MIKLKDFTINPALLVIDVQNGFVSKGGSYDLLGMETSHYRDVIPKIRDLINLCKNVRIPIFYTQAVRESSGIDLLTRSHKILPKSREERIKKKPICVRETWDAEIVDEIKPAEGDHVVIKRRDSAFHDTEIGVWLRSLNIDTLIFCGIDTSICVETSLRDAFNIGYDVVLISDATASNNKKHYESTLENVKGYYGMVMDMKELCQYLPQSQLSSISNRNII